MTMENLMKALMESAGQPQQNAQPQGAGGDVLSEVLGGLMGGGQQGTQQQGGGDMLSGVLGGLLGGGTGGNSGDQMLGALEQIIGGRPGTGQPLNVNQGAAMNMGGMGMNDPVMGMIQPIVNQLAAKANIPPQIAMTVVSIAVHYLLSSHPSTSTKAPMDLGGFMQELSGGNVSANTLHRSGMVNDVVQATGLNQQDAVKTLSTVFGALGSSLR